MSIEHENFDNIAQDKNETDLEQYGVWVKKTPEEALAAEVQETETEPDSSDFFLDDLDFSDIPDDTDISSDSFNDDLNTKIDEALEAVQAEEAAELDETLTEQPADVLDESAEPIPVSVEDFNLDDIEELDAPVQDERFKQDEIKTEDSIEDTIDIDIDEYLPAEKETETDIIDEKPLDIHLSFEDDFEHITPDFPRESTDYSSSTDEIEGVEDVTAFFTDDAQSSSDSENTDNAFEKIETINENEPENVDISEFEIPEEAAFDDVQTKSADELQNTQAIDEGADEIQDIDIASFDTEPDFSETPEASQAEAESQAPSPSSEHIYNIAVKADDDDFYETDEKEKEEETVQTEENIQSMGSSLLEKIMDELSLLRKDITGLKTDMDALKTSETDSEKEAEEDKTAGGFFADDEDDDTIALSGDELNNILTSADFTAENEQRPVSSETAPENTGLKAEKNLETESAVPPVLNLEEHELEEPQLDNIEFDVEEAEEEQLPGEIEIPVIDNLVVDSSSDDFFAEEDTPKEIDETAMHFLSKEPVEEKTDAQTDDNSGEKTEEDVAELLDEEDESETTLYEPAEENEEDLNQYSPVNAVFNSRQWQPEGEIPEEEESETLFGKNIKTPRSAKRDEKTVNIPQNMREEIKSVLAYMDQLLENLPEEKIVEFAQSEHFPVYKKLFTELGLS